MGIILPFLFALSIAFCTVRGLFLCQGMHPIIRTKLGSESIGRASVEQTENQE